MTSDFRLWRTTDVSDRESPGSCAGYHPDFCTVLCGWRAFFLQGFGILSFEAAKYSWYVNMYIGLFLFIPYLNKMYNGLESQKEKRNLIFTMLLLSGIPEVLNSVRFSLPWTMIYNDPSEFLAVFPNWWSNIYPITFYFIGAYLSDYPLKFSKKTTLCLSFAAMIIIGTYNFGFSCLR